MTKPTLGHPRHSLDKAIQSPVRLSIVASLATVDEAQFAHIQHSIEVSAAVLSKQAASLEEVGYLKIRKGYFGKRPRTWLSLTKTGRQAFERHVEALNSITAQPATPGNGLLTNGFLPKQLR